jgi:hypothetical protein
VCFWYFYQSQIISYWNQGIENSQELSVNSWNAYANIFQKISFPALKLPTFNLPSFDFGKIFGSNKTQNPTPEKTAPIQTVEIKDCGTTVAPDLNNSQTAEKNAVLACLGDSALLCNDARGILTDPLFPTIFEISKVGNVCDFKLSYADDSALSDITGQKLAGQYISCPIDIVKAIDNANPASPKFIAPDTTDLSKYASQIYFFGTLGLFVENNLDKNKMEMLGCNGPYIDSVIASYQKMQSKK